MLHQDTFYQRLVSLRIYSPLKTPKREQTLQYPAVAMRENSTSPQLLNMLCYYHANTSGSAAQKQTSKDREVIRITVQKKK